MRAGPLFDLPRYLSRDLSGKIEGPGLSLRGISWHPQIIKISAWSSTKIKQLKINVYLWYTAISKKVVGKTVHATIPKGNMGYNQDTCSWHCSCRTYFCCFPLALANIRPWNFLPFFEISLKNSELKTTHNTFRDCRVHFFRQPFSKQLYTIEC